MMRSLTSHRGRLTALLGRMVEAFSALGRMCRCFFSPRSIQDRLSQPIEKAYELGHGSSQLVRPDSRHSAEPAGHRNPCAIEATERHDGNPPTAVRTTGAPVNWVSPSEFRFDGLFFTCDVTSHLNRPTDEQRITIAKDRGIIDALYEQLLPVKPRTMLEIGIAQGGSAFLHTSLFELSKYVGVDLRREDATVLTLLEKKYGSDRVKLYYETSQGDKARIAQICAQEFDGLCDVVIDDASHQYELSVQTLEAALPHLRPGGFYIIEDWSWAHWPGPKWQDSKTGYGIDKPALSNLVFELTMLCASRPDLLSDGLIKKGFAVFRRGPSELNWRTFKLSESYLTQGRSFITL